MSVVVRDTLPLLRQHQYAKVAPARAQVVALERRGDDIFRAEMAALQADHAARMAALEARLRTAEQALQRPPAGAAGQPAAGPAPLTTAAALADAAPPPAPPPAPAAVTGPNAFNPAMSLILSGLYTRTSQDPARYAIGGFRQAPGAELGPGTRGFSLAESELGFAASIDPWWQGAANIALHAVDSVSVEEAYVQTTALGHGLGLKAGRFFSSVGYLNSQHAHTWDFVDNPLAYQAMLGTQYGDDGLQLRWLAPTDQFVELTAELGRGRSFPGDGTGRNGAGMAALAAHLGGDIGDSQSWRAGLSLLQARADGQALTQALTARGAAGQPVDASFSGRTRVWVLDGVWKWAPDGNATRTSLKLQGEWLLSQRDGRLAPADGSAGPWRSSASGGYLQAVWQFMPRWRVGLRGDRLDPGGAEDAALLGGSGFRPSRATLMLDYSASEFSRIRLQLARDHAQPGAADTQLMLQYQMSLGAHGAHGY